MLTPCDRPHAGELETNADLARFTSAALFELEVCAAKVDALNTYFTEMETNANSGEKN